MLLIWGWKARTKTLDSGTFFCPREGGDRHYEHKQARRWFTFFWIPLIPLNELGDFIECRHCQATYYPDVLKAKTASQIEDVTTIAIRHVAVSMLLADGVVHDAERQAAIQVIARFASVEYSRADLDQDLQTLHVSGLRDHLEELGAILNEHGKESVLSAAVYLAGSDGSIDAEEMSTVHQIGDALTMSRAHIEGTISTELSRLGITR